MEKREQQNLHWSCLLYTSTLKLKNVCYKIGEREILKNICFKCSQGEIIGIIGPNGSGKTTLLKTINGINKIDRGVILLNDKSIDEYKEKELARKISFMNKNTNPVSYTHLAARERGWIK